MQMFNAKRTITLILTAILVLSLSACGPKAPVSGPATLPAPVTETVDSPPVEEVIYAIGGRGNTVGNISNGGRAALYDDYIYFSDASLGNDNAALYKIHVDGSGQQKLCDDEGIFLNAIDGWVYYTNCSDNYTLYRISIDGSERQKLNDDDSGYPNVVGGWIYFTNNSDNNTLYRISVDGKEQHKITDEGQEPTDDVRGLNVVGEWLYHTEGNHDSILYKTRTDGRMLQKLSDDVANTIIVVDEWVYYWTEISDKEGEIIYRVRTDGSEKQILIEGYISAMNIDDGWIYYSSYGDELAKMYRDFRIFGESEGIYRVKINGSDKQRISDVSGQSVNIAGEWIYYINLRDNRALYKVRVDGTEHQPVLTTEAPEQNTYSPPSDSQPPAPVSAA